MTNKNLKRSLLVIDLQYIQTGAYQRGMGRYFVNVFGEILKLLTDDNDIVCLYTEQLPDKNITDFEAEIAALAPASKVTYQRLPLQVHTFRPGQYAHAFRQNSRITTEYVGKLMQEQQYDKVVWFGSCLTQEPMVPAMPTQPSVIKVALWHDMMPYLFHRHYFTDHHSAHARSYLGRLNILPLLDRIFVISNTTGDDLVKHLSIMPEKIVPIYGSYDATMDNAPKKDELIEGLTKPFFLFIASSEPNKNVDSTLEAFQHFNNKHNGAYQLVVTSKFEPRKQYELLKRYGDDILFVGHIPQSSLEYLYRTCQALVFPSKYEGLGMPIIEAVANGRQVVCSEIPVFQEMSGGDTFFWCDPYDVTSITAAIEAAVKAGTKLTTAQKESYKAILEKFNWRAVAKRFVDGLKTTEKPHPGGLKIAVVAPHPASFSSIGKFAAELHPYLLERGEVHYYYDSGASDKHHGFVKFSYLQEYEHLYPVQDLLAKDSTYDVLLYHMGNSDHHSLTYLLAHAKPSTVILHDTDLSGNGLAAQMRNNGYLSKERVDIEYMLENTYLGKPSRFITSLVSSQKKVITHSEAAYSDVNEYLIRDVDTVKSHHPMNRVTMLPTKGHGDAPLHLGLAGIMSEVKGTNSIEWLLEQTQNLKNCRLSVFGFGFFVDKSELQAIAERYPNVEVLFDLTDYEFQRKLDELDVMINFRTVYKGEASRATLEAFRAGVVPIVRDIGWFGELRDDTCFKIAEIEELPAIITKYAKDPTESRKLFFTMTQSAQDMLRDKFGFKEYVDELVRGASHNG